MSTRSIHIPHRESESQGHSGEFPGFMGLRSPPPGLQLTSVLASAVWETSTESQQPHSSTRLKCAVGFHMCVANTIRGVIYWLLSSPTAVFSPPDLAVDRDPPLAPQYRAFSPSTSSIAPEHPELCKTDSKHSRKYLLNK